MADRLGSDRIGSDRIGSDRFGRRTSRVLADLRFDRIGRPAGSIAQHGAALDVSAMVDIRPLSAVAGWLFWLAAA